MYHYLSKLVVATALGNCLISPLSAGELILWENDGTLNTSGTYQSKVVGLAQGSSVDVVNDPLGTGRGSVLRYIMSGSTGGTEWGGLAIDVSPFQVSPGSQRVWDNRIVLGDASFVLEADVYTPTSSTMTFSDGVSVILRFWSSQNPNFNDRIEWASVRYTDGSAYQWDKMRLRGTIPLVDKVGNVIDQMEPIISVADFGTNAGNNVFAFVDNVKLSIRVPGAGNGLPQGALVLNPGTADTDNDNLYDYWENLYGAQTLSANVDTDGDGRTNLQESLAGTDPFNSGDFLYLRIDKSGSDANLCWPIQNFRTSQIVSSDSLSGFTPITTNPVVVDGENQITVTPAVDKQFYQVTTAPQDNDSDSVPDFIESIINTQTNNANSSLEAKSYDLDNDGVAETTISGDLATYNEVFRREDSGDRPTESQASRFLMQSTFGPTFGDIHKVQDMGYSAWIEDQFLLPPFYTLPAVQEMEDDRVTRRNGGSANPWLSGYFYTFNSNFLFGFQFTDVWIRAAIRADDQLRQRVAFALSQILVASRADAALTNKPLGTARYYDLMIEHAFGNYKDLLMDVSLSPYMGLYLSHLGNRKADLSIGRFPDENYAREIMQLFSIGLFELNNDGTRKVDGNGNFIETYDTEDITQYARVFTGLSTNGSFIQSSFTESALSMPMKMVSSEHDFGEKTLLRGQVIPSRTQNDANAFLDIEDAVTGLFNHPNTPPFICRQLIQFLVTSNPSPAYVNRVANAFIDNGSGVRGDMKAIIRAILLDEEARDPGINLGSNSFGYLREPVIRVMHMAKIGRMDRFPELHFWDFGGDTGYRARSLQEPMVAPTVFNYYRPDFRLFGVLNDNQLDGPAFGITDGYSSISFPNELWDLIIDGFEQGNNYSHEFNWNDLTMFSNDLDRLLDRVSLLFTAGSMSASSRAIIKTQLSNVTDPVVRARLASYLAIMCPEGATTR